MRAWVLLLISVAVVEHGGEDILGVLEALGHLGVAGVEGSG